MPGSALGTLTCPAPSFRQCYEAVETSDPSVVLLMDHSWQIRLNFFKL